MGWKLLGVCLVLLAIGVAGGWALGDARTDAPTAIRSVGPVSAQSPAAPTQSATTCFTDPPVAALGVDLASTSERLSTGKRRGYAITLDVPDGWRTNVSGQARWAMTDSPTFNTYAMRVNIIADQLVSVPAALDSRLVQLRQAQKDGNLPGFHVESRSTDSFVATYVVSGYCRVIYERFLSLGGSSAYVDLAVIGREEDRPGLMDLLARTAQSMRVS